MGVFSDIWNVGNNVAKKVAPRQDPMAFLQGSAVPSSEQLYQDALSQVSGAYNAQLANLDAQEDQFNRKAKEGDRQIAGLYDSLGKEIGKNKGVLSSIYDQGAATSKRNTAQTKGAINQQYSDTNNEMAALFDKLGIQAAAPEAMAGGNRDRNMLAGLVDFQGNSAQQAFGLDKSAALSFNTAQQNISGLTGRNKRADLVSQLNDALFSTGQARNETYGAMSDAVNQRQYQLENDALQRQQQMDSMMYEMYADQQKSAAAGQLTPQQQYAQMSGDEKTAQKAATYFGPQDAPYVMELLSGVANYQNEGVYPNRAHFIRSVIAENRKQQAAGHQALSDSELSALAGSYWDEGGVGTKNMPIAGL